MTRLGLRLRLRYSAARRMPQRRTFSRPPDRPGRYRQTRNRGATGSDESEDSASTDHNAADVTFVSEMIPHYEQAIEMSKLAQDRAANPEVKALADRIEAAQRPEIEATHAAEISQLQGLLESE
ncbi:MAG: DUF305 domain-containing protein [Mycobacteriales bacterium]